MVLTGFMGAGKTATGRALAALLGWDFVDLDDELERSATKPIPAIFAEDGEERFRDLESQELARVLRRDRIVVATGGGVLLRSNNRRRLSGRMVINLDASPAECVRRLRHSETERPLLAGDDPEAAAERIYGSRRSLYESVERRVDTEGKGPDAVAREIIDRFLGETGKGHPD